MVCLGLGAFVAGVLCLAGTAFAGPYHDPHCGGRQVIVHLFEWKWSSIAKECMDYLGPMGFCGVQVSPPNEHMLVTRNAMRPWWERYQPVSYKLTSRSGDENEFKVMVETCKSVGVRIYVDAIINHMAASSQNGTGSAGSLYDSDTLDFPGVPYTKVNFNDGSKCPSSNRMVTNFSDPSQLRNCFRKNLAELDNSQSYVQDQVSGYFNHLIDLGVAGFRINAAEYLWPDDIKALQAKTKDLPEGGRPFFYQELNAHQAVDITEYFEMGYVTEFKYGQRILGKVHDIGSMNQLYDPSSGMVPSSDAMVFVDNHDNQRTQANAALTFKQPALYKRAVAFTLAYNYGFTKIMSSYNFFRFEQGPPHNDDFSTKDVNISSSGECLNGWVCEHRWKPIGHMAVFRNAVAGQGVANWTFKDGVVSFNRGDRGFFAMANDEFIVNINTGLPQGKYCDLISACARMIDVDDAGNAIIRPAYIDDPFVAIITEDGKPVDKFPLGKGNPPPTPKPLTTDYRRTVILIEKQTQPGTDLFIDGGIDHDHRAGCKSGVVPSPCSIPIRHVDPGLDPHFNKVKAWSVGDNYLDWNGAEPGQGTYHGQRAHGTPAYWSTTQTTHPGHSKYNKYGPHYWVVEVDMDCSQTINSYFEFKARIHGRWESNIFKGGACTGDSAGTPPFKSKNHFARGGYLNVFHYNQTGCEIHKLE